MITDSGLPMILASVRLQSLRMSEAVTASTGTFVLKFNVGIASSPFSLMEKKRREVEKEEEEEDEEEGKECLVHTTTIG